MPVSPIVPNGERWSLKARWVFPVSGAPIPDGIVSIQGERIESVDTQVSDPPAQDLGNVAIVPGLVNAHSHLEFSDLQQPLGNAGSGFDEWIRSVIDHRRSQPHSDRFAVISHGLREAARSGTTTLGEIATSPWAGDAADQQPLDVTQFLEIIALRRDKIDPALNKAAEYVRDFRAAPHFCAGFSPHAPYTVHPELLSALVELSVAHQLPLAMHLAESREELQLIAGQGGPLRELLLSLDAWDGQAIPPGTRPLDYLRELSAGHRALIIHGNYLTTDECDFLAANSDHMAVVYCPRTHAYFQHTTYPLEEWLNRGVLVALGTDSRASNPDLSLLEEMRFVARQHPGVPTSTVLRLGTLVGAKALGCDREIGSLEPGKYANLCVVPLPEHEPTDPHELLFNSPYPVALTLYRGA